MAEPLLRRIRRRLLGKVPPRYLRDRYPAEKIGEHSYGGLEVVSFGDDTRFSIGKYCSFAAGVKLLLGGEHRTDWVTTYPFSDIDPSFADIPGHPASRGDITIGNDVWIGRESMITSGVKIGDGAVIAARSLVNRDVAPYTVVGGQPARYIKSRFDDVTIERLLAIAWWDWPDDRVRKAVPLLLQSDIASFLAAAEAGEI